MDEIMPFYAIHLAKVIPLQNAHNALTKAIQLQRDNMAGDLIGAPLLNDAMAELEGCLLSLQDEEKAFLEKYQLKEANKSKEDKAVQTDKMVEQEQ